MAFLLALGLTLYPVISNYVNQKYASQIHTAYQEVMEQADDSDLLKAKELADAYNHTLVPGATAAYSQEGLQAASADYDSQLDVAGNGIMGYVEIPKISVNLPIYHGTENDSLERGIGHLLGSSLPVGGGDFRGTHPHGHHGKPGMGSDGTELSAHPVRPGLSGISHYGLCGDLLRAGAEHLRIHRYKHRHLDLHGLHGAALLLPVQDQQPCPLRIQCPLRR